MFRFMSKSAVKLWHSEMLCCLSHSFAVDFFDTGDNGVILKTGS